MPLRLLKGIKYFKNNHFKEKEGVFAALSKGQAPDVLFFGCIDSRIDLRLATNANPGESLAHRNPGNIVTPYSSTPSGEASSIEFALMHLNVIEVIVCGHSHCGAMQALMTPGIGKKLTSTEAWLTHAKPALDHVHEHHPELEENPSIKLKCLTQKNILLQIEHLKTHPAVAKRLAEGKLKIHGWYYEFEKGEFYIYNANKGSFISFEETVDEIAQEKLKHIVQEEALNYLNNLTPLLNADHYSLLKRFSSMNQVTPIWEHIKTKVRSKLQEELGELYLTSDGSFNLQFYELIKKGRLVQVVATGNKYQQIEQLFNQALKCHSHHVLIDGQKKLLAAVTQLKDHSLDRFAAGDKHFDFQNCMFLAKSTQDLTAKLMNNEATPLDIETFKKISQSFESTRSCSSILKIILESITTIALGIMAGFLIGGAPGAVVGSVTGVVSAVLAVGIWAQKREPAQQLAITAEQITNPKTTEVCCFSDKIHPL